MTTAAGVAMLADLGNSGWAVAALAVAGLLFYVAARLPKGDAQ